jgi:adenylate kinase family enzyme
MQDELMMSVLEERLSEPDCHQSGVLLDGFPRTQTQALMLKKSKLKVTCTHFDTGMHPHA